MPEGKNVRYALGEKGAWLGIVSNVALFGFKMAAGVAGRSQAMVADALHTAGDVLTSVAVLFGFKLAKQPPDEHHPFGHGRAESIMAKLASVALIAMGIGVALRSVRLIVLSEASVPGSIALFAALVSIAVKSVVYRKVIRTARKVRSSSLETDAYHHRSDVLSSVAAVFGIAGARMGWPYLDPMAGIIVAGFIVKAGAEAFHRAYDELMDAALSVETRADIISAALVVEGVREVTSVMSRKAGIEMFLEIIIKVDGAKTVAEGHEITVRVERSIKGSIEGVSGVVVHAEPY